MNIKSKKLLVVFAVVLIATVIAPIRSNAGLQANKGGTSLTYTTASQFFDGMRKMETKYGTLGKEAVLNDKYLDTTNNGNRFQLTRPPLPAKDAFRYKSSLPARAGIQCVSSGCYG